jgi:hypothetical protein
VTGLFKHEGPVASLEVIGVRYLSETAGKPLQEVESAGSRSPG